MARTITYQQAINEALAQEMERDPTVVVFGEDVVGGAGAPGEDDAWGGVLGVTKGLYGQVPGPRARHADLRVRATSAPPPARRRPACARSPS